MYRVKENFIFRKGDSLVVVEGKIIQKKHFHIGTIKVVIAEEEESFGDDGNEKEEAVDVESLENVEEELGGEEVSDEEAVKVAGAEIAGEAAGSVQHCPVKSTPPMSVPLRREISKFGAGEDPQPSMENMHTNMAKLSRFAHDHNDSRSIFGDLPIPLTRVTYSQRNNLDKDSFRQKCLSLQL